jgi:hypothetical protein
MPTAAPPDGLPVYRLLSGPDDAAFCQRVSEALALGYRLYGPPAAYVQRHDGDRRAGPPVARRGGHRRECGGAGPR